MFEGIRSEVGRGGVEGVRSEGVKEELFKNTKKIG